jgi:hypothetical protein
MWHDSWNFDIKTTMTMKLNFGRLMAIHKCKNFSLTDIRNKSKTNKM